MTKALRVGAAVAVAYVGVVAATVALTHRHVRPLLDAVGPAAPYRWVNPPPDFAAGNVRPAATELTFGIQDTDPPPGGASEDSQFVFSLPRGAIPAKGTAKVVAAMKPVDPDKLGPLPAKTFADGNAYQVVFTYAPGGDAAPIKATGSVLLTVPVPADAIMFSPDGRTWQTVKSKSASATSIGGDMPGAGYYLATSPNVLIGGGGGGGSGRLVLPIVITAVVAAALVATPVLLRRRRPQQGGRGRPSPQRRRR